MDESKKNQIILVVVVVLLLCFVFGFVFFNIKKGKSENGEFTAKFKQIYSSDYDLMILDNQYILGLYDGKINVVIDQNGKEISRTNTEIIYSDFYKMNDGNYLISNYENDQMSLYVFDGKKIELYDVVSDIHYGKPIVNSDQELVGFIEIKDNGFDYYDVYKKEVSYYDDYTIPSNDIYEMKSDNTLIVMKDNLYGAIHLDEEVVIPFQYKSIKDVGKNTFICQDKNGNYGIIENDSVIVKFSYKVINRYGDYYLIVDKKNKMSLFDSYFNNLTGFKMDYDSLIDFDLNSESNSIMLYQSGKDVFIVNNYLEDYYKTEYDKHNLYVYHDKELNKYEEYGFFMDDNVYLYDKDYHVIIYDHLMNELGNIELSASKIESITKINDYMMEIVYYYQDGIKTLKYYDYSGREVEYDLGKQVIRNDTYVGFLSNDQKVLTIQSKNKTIAELKDDNIRLNGDIIVTKNSIYKLETS